MAMTKDKVILSVISHAVMIFITVMAILPFVLVFMSSVTDENTLILNGYSFVPQKYSLQAYEYILKKGEKVFRAYGVTALVTFVGTFVNVLISAMLAYPLSLKRLPGRKFFSFFVLFTMLFNGGLVPTYIMYSNLFHIKNTLFALLIPGLLMHTMNVLLMRTFFATNIPGELLEAAEVDGASQFFIFLRIVLPLGTPILVTMGLFAGLTYWNDWMNGLYYLTGREGLKLYGIQNFLYKIVSDIQYLNSTAMSNADQELMKLPTTSIKMAIAFVAILPILVIFPFLQRYFASGILQGAIKG